MIVIDSPQGPEPALRVGARRADNKALDLIGAEHQNEVRRLKILGNISGL